MSDTISLVVLNARIYKHQMEALHEVAEKHGKPIADLLRDILEQSLPNYATSQETMVAKLDKMFHVVANIYATQMAAKSEAAKIDTPEGVFLIPTSEKKGTFVCQGCGEDRPNRKRHMIQIMDEYLSFGDCCYFNENYKTKIIQLL